MTRIRLEPLGPSSPALGHAPEPFDAYLDANGASLCDGRGSHRRGNIQITPWRLLATIKGGDQAGGVQIVRHPTLDVALVRLDFTSNVRSESPVSSLGAPTRDRATSLVGSSLYTQGYGVDGVKLDETSVMGAATGRIAVGTTRCTDGAIFALLLSIIA